MLESLALCSLRTETAGFVSGFSHRLRLLIQTWSYTSRGLLTEDWARQAQLWR